tara:strand:+ start:1694 stop:1915 length:222 start_codon:yes stop_codon:yes gene_type:complete
MGEPEKINENTPSFTSNVRKEGKMLKITVPHKLHVLFQEGDIVDVKRAYRPTKDELEKMQKKSKTENGTNEQN